MRLILYSSLILTKTQWLQQSRPNQTLTIENELHLLTIKSYINRGAKHQHEFILLTLLRVLSGSSVNRMNLYIDKEKLWKNRYSLA